MSNQLHVLSRRAEEKMIESFMAEAQKAIEKKAKRKEKARLRTKTAPFSDDAEHFKRLSIERQTLVDLRLKRGYHRIGRVELSGYQLPFEVREQGLRSSTLESNAALMWPSLVRKRKNLRAAWTNGTIAGTDSKLLALDMPYVEGNTEFLGFIRIDTDLIWSSTEACQHVFQELVDDGKLACLPHFLVGLKLSDGRFIRPHAIWCLPYGDAVWNAPGKPGLSKAPLDLFRSTYYGMCEAMIEVGADPAAPWSTQRVKNPLSPEWHTVCPQDTDWPNLSKMSEYVDLAATRERATRKAAAFQSEHSIEASNQLFNVYQAAAFQCLREWHFSGDPAYQAAMAGDRRGAVVDAIHAHLESITLSASVSKKWNASQLAALQAKVADYAAMNWNPEKVDQRKVNRSACMHMISPSDSLAERQAIGGGYASAIKAEKTLGELRNAISAMKADGVAITKKGLAKVSGISLKTIKARWSEVELLLSNSEGVVQCIGKKDGQPSIITANNNTTMNVTGTIESGNLYLIMESESEIPESVIVKIAPQIAMVEPVNMDTGFTVSRLETAHQQPETGEWWMRSDTSDDDYSTSADDEIGTGYSFAEESDYDDWDGENPYND